MLDGPGTMHQVCNATESEVRWHKIGAPEREFGPEEKFDLTHFRPEDPKLLRKELADATWLPKEGRTSVGSHPLIRPRP